MICPGGRLVMLSAQLSPPPGVQGSVPPCALMQAHRFAPGSAAHAGGRSTHDGGGGVQG